MTVPMWFGIRPRTQHRWNILSYVSGNMKSNWSTNTVITLSTRTARFERTVLPKEGRRQNADWEIFVYCCIHERRTNTRMRLKGCTWWSEDAYHIYTKLFGRFFLSYLSYNSKSPFGVPLTFVILAGWVTNSVDLDETPRSVASDLGLHFHHENMPI